VKQADGDRDGAIADFAKAIQLQPDNEAAHRYLGLAQEAKRRSAHEFSGLVLVSAILIGISIWVRHDAMQRGMSRHWGSGVLLIAIVCLPLYLVVRKSRLTAKCAVCGRDVAPSLSFCEECKQGPSENDTYEGRPGRILG
jgi:TPR repeat